MLTAPPGALHGAHEVGRRGGPRPRRRGGPGGGRGGRGGGGGGAARAGGGGGPGRPSVRAGGGMAGGVQARPAVGPPVGGVPPAVDRDDGGRDALLQPLDPETVLHLFLLVHFETLLSGAN